MLSRIRYAVFAVALCSCTPRYFNFTFTDHVTSSSASSTPHPYLNPSCPVSYYEGPLRAQLVPSYRQLSQAFSPPSLTQVHVLRQLSAPQFGNGGHTH